MWVNIFVSLYWCILLEMTKYHSSLCSFSEKCLDYYGSHFPPTTRAIQWHWFTSRCCYNMLIYVFANTSGPIRAWIRLSFFAHTTEPFSNHLDLFLYVMLVFTIQSVPDGKNIPFFEYPILIKNTSVNCDKNSSLDGHSWWTHTHQHQL